MITALELRNFKAFDELRLPFQTMTVLTGMNSTGKSSIIQALLLMITERTASGEVPLNDDHGLSLGEAADVLSASAQAQEISIRIETEDDPVVRVLAAPLERSSTLVVVEESGSNFGLEVAGEGLSFSYLSAERLGPRDIQEVAVDIETLVGHRGEFTAHVLAQMGRQQVGRARRHPDTLELGDVVTLSAQAEYWMSSIVRPIRLEAIWIPNVSAATLRFKSPEVLTDWLRPANVGFGLSYALPIVVAGLTIQRRGLLIVESPEAHLHPAGQSLIGRFLARVASAGVQVVVETHSDHFLNGIRRAVAEDRTLSTDQLLVHFFHGEMGLTSSIKIDSSGALSEWPRGFFDQGELDLGALARAKGNA